MTLEVTGRAVHAFPVTAPDTPEARAATGRLGRHIGSHFSAAAAPRAR